MSQDSSSSAHSRYASIQVQSIIYHMDVESIERALESLARAIEIAIGDGVCAAISISYGDTSSHPCIDEATLETLRQRFPNIKLSYRFFGKNLGSARGHNALAKDSSDDFLLILNPDVVVSPRLFENLLAPLANAQVGLVEAKQIPVEHPKLYDPLTGETGWAATACALTQNSVFKGINGFDADTFFLYCDDVDYSWRVREAGYKVIFMPAAVVFHDKRISSKGAWQPTSAERYFSAEASLLMAHKWSRPDLVNQISKQFLDGSADEMKALLKFEERRKSGDLPEPRDPHHKISGFDSGLYTSHRYKL